MLLWRGLLVNSYHIVDILTFVELASSIVALAVMQYRRQIGQYKPLALFLFVRIASVAICLPLMSMAGKQINKNLAYDTYFYVYWSSYAIEAVLGFCMIYGIYNLAMAPLKGLQRLGMLMFRWAAGIAVAIATTMALGPHTTSAKFIMRAVTQLQQTQSVLTLCMLLFVCLAIRPMGLSYRSKIFGVSLGLGIVAATDLVGAAWVTHSPTIYSLYSIVSGSAICLTLFIWVGYFAIPEPRRRMIILPTTSPFLRWNQISLALGDEPGFVALGDITPDMFAPAEVEVMRRAAVKMNYPVAN